MTTYDAAAGMDDVTINGIVSGIYALVYPKLFRGTIPVGALNVASVTFDINQVPTVNLQASASTTSSILGALDRNEYGETSGLSADDKALIANGIATATFGLDAASVALTVTYSNGTPATTTTGALSTRINIQASTIGKTDYLTLHFLSAEILLPSDPALAALLNGVLDPLLIPYLNTNFLDPIRIPALPYQSIKMSLPLPVVAAPYVTAYSARGSVEPDVPAPISWPTGVTYMATDTALLLAAVDLLFPIGPGTKFDWEIISGHIGAQVLAPTSVQIDSHGKITTSLEAKADMDLTLHTPWPFKNVKFGPKATVSMPAELTPSVEKSLVIVTITGVKDPTFDFKWGIPGWINWLFVPLEKGLAAALNAALGPLIKKSVQIPIPVCNIPQIEFTLGGTTMGIVMATTKWSVFEDMLLVSGKASVANAG